jgi:hypothetical protein
MKILHTCSSILARPNGISRYINSAIRLQTQAGHQVVFASDSDVTQYITASTQLWSTTNPESEYVPNMRDGHVWLQVDYSVVEKLKSVIADTVQDYDLVIAHDLHSYLAVDQLAVSGIFIQHESDLLNTAGRYSFLSDEYLAQQIAIVDNPSATWRMGMTVRYHDRNPAQGIFTPAAFELTPLAPPQSGRSGLLYIGDATERKGAREFAAMARRIGGPVSVISWDSDPELFAGFKQYRFDIRDHSEMLRMINRHAVAYIPSKNECPGLAIQECLQYIPVVVDGQYPWTRNLPQMGATVVTGVQIQLCIERRLKNFEYSNHDFVNYANAANDFWRTL